MTYDTANSSGSLIICKKNPTMSASCRMQPRIRFQIQWQLQLSSRSPTVLQGPPGWKKKQQLCMNLSVTLMMLCNLMMLSYTRISHRNVQKSRVNVSKTAVTETSQCHSKRMTALWLLRSAVGGMLSYTNKEHLCFFIGEAFRHIGRHRDYTPWRRKWDWRAKINQAARETVTCLWIPRVYLKHIIVGGTQWK